MAEIRPFRGIRYDTDRVGDAGRVVAPPYDVIDDALQQALYETHPNNVVRIIRGRDEAGDSDANNRYTRAAEAFRDWQTEGVLRRDEEEGIYLYAQDFEAITPAGPVPKSRLGIVTLVRVEPFGEGYILPHEHTMPGPKVDRLALMRHIGATCGQIFSLYSDPEGRVRDVLKGHLEGEPLFGFEDREGVQHRLWRVADREAIEGVAAFLADKPLFIADGHHRYETAVVYRDERALAEGVAPDGQPYGYRMQTLVNMDDTEGMAIYPIHRVVMDLGADGVARLEAGLQELFDVERASLGETREALRELRRGGRQQVFGFCTGEAKEVQYLTLKPSVDPAALDKEEHSSAWRGLNSGLLQLVLGHILDLDSETLTRGEKVKFVKVEAEALSLLKEAPDRAGFFLNPVDMARLREVVLAGERMPPKSTFFYPKVYSGLVIQDLNAF